MRSRKPVKLYLRWLKSCYVFSNTHVTLFLVSCIDPKKKYIMEKKTSSTVVHILEKMLSKEWRCVTNKTVFFYVDATQRRVPLKNSSLILICIISLLAEASPMFGARCLNVWSVSGFDINQFGSAADTPGSSSFSHLVLYLISNFGQTLAQSEFRRSPVVQTHSQSIHFSGKITINH